MKRFFYVWQKQSEKEIAIKYSLSYQLSDYSHWAIAIAIPTSLEMVNMDFYATIHI